MFAERSLKPLYFTSKVGKTFQNYGIQIPRKFIFESKKRLKTFSHVLSPVSHITLMVIEVTNSHQTAFFENRLDPSAETVRREKAVICFTKIQKNK